MFTGIIEHLGTVKSIAPANGGKRLIIDLGPLCKGLVPGESVAVDGLCLTATTIMEPMVAFDVVTESLSRSTLGALRPGRKVNLERALPANGRLDGHIVQGHVDGIATVKNIRRGREWNIEFTAETQLIRQMVPKGSVAINGVSLTLADVGRESFAVALIPTTLDATTLGAIGVGDNVNIETDIIGKYVLKYLENLVAGKNSGSLTLDKLKQAGYV